MTSAEKQVTAELGGWFRRGLAAAVALFCGVSPTLAFEKIALADAHAAFVASILRVGGRPAVALVKWTTPFALSIEPSAEWARPQIEQTVRRYTTVARLPLMLVTANDSRAQFVVSAVESGSCRTTVRWSAERLTRVEMMITFDAIRLERCVNHEGLHGFGFRSHPGSADSVLSSRQPAIAKATALDFLLLETLYDPRLSSGMPADAASATACRILSEKLNVAPRECPL